MALSEALFYVAMVGLSKEKTTKTACFTKALFDVLSYNSNAIKRLIN